MAENVQYAIAVPEKYHDKDGKEHTAWTTVRTAFQNDKGRISLRLSANIASPVTWCYSRKMTTRQTNRAGERMGNAPRRYQAGNGLPLGVCRRRYFSLCLSVCDHRRGRLVSAV